MGSNNLYILILHNNKKVTKKIGHLGIFDFLPGYYFYVGSAKKNLYRRIERHLSEDKRIHWHIDYITEDIKIIRAVAFSKVRFTECELAQNIKKEFEFEEPIKGFGSSDCRCRTHLFFKSS